jgi:hypothetical protein
LISDTNPTINPEMDSLIKEGQEITAIIGSIINKTKG